MDVNIYHILQSDSYQHNYFHLILHIFILDLGYHIQQKMELHVHPIDINSQTQLAHLFPELGSIFGNQK